jgi:hypothetical protein
MTSLHLERVFPYRRADRPTVVVRLVYGDSQIDTEATLATGASLCVFDASLADVLGVPVTRARRVPIVGLDGTIRTAPLVLLDLAVLPESAGIRMGQVAVAFLDGIERTVGNLLGRQGFFSAVDLGLSHARRTIHLGLTKA